MLLVWHFERHEVVFPDRGERSVKAPRLRVWPILCLGFEFRFRRGSFFQPDQGTGFFRVMSRYVKVDSIWTSFL